ncbi:MAG: DNA polymerase III subunit delta [Bacteroidales bacterium]|nr:DNA polymerase III subunit delta [Bacteroidales bacterium]
MLFKDIIGQEKIKEYLIEVAKKNKIPHALLFTGPEGAGKLATAIAFAQYVNCLDENKNDDSCNNCESCSKIKKLLHPDIHFVFPIYKGSSKGNVCDDFIELWRNFILNHIYFKATDWYNIIAKDKGQPTIYAEETLQIINKANTKKSEAKYKFIIIYQPERMNISSANKLLKILEEPYFGTVFILISSNQELLLPTIVSRCQHIRFPVVDFNALKEYLKIKFPNVDEQILHQSIILSEGNVAHCIELLNRDEALKNYLNLYIQIMRIAYTISTKKTDYQKITQIVEELLQLSKEQQKDFIKYCIRYTRDNLMYGLKQKAITFLSKEEREFSEKFSNFVTLSFAENLYRNLSETLYHIERNANARIVFTDLILKIKDYF